MVMSRCLRPTAERKRRAAATLHERMASRRSKMRRSAPVVEVINGKDGIVFRCSHVCCRDVFPKCAARLSDKCLQGDVSYRWIHISAEEHLCQHCYAFFNHGGGGFAQLSHWRKKWKNGGGKSYPSIKYYIAEEVLPFWAQCDECAKWRPMKRLIPGTQEKFTCLSNGNACDEAEHPAVKRVGGGEWFKSLSTPVMLKNSPAMRFVGTEYFCDLVGISPTSDVHDSHEIFPMSEKLLEVMRPFLTPNGYDRAMNIDPSAMEEHELQQFPMYRSHTIAYLAIRNLIVALWSINPKEWVTPEKCVRWTVCRGLIRVWLVSEVPEVLRYLSQKGVVNFGLLPAPSKFFLNTCRPGASVIIVGAGISGLVAARHLQNFGCNVLVLESRDNIGGRINDTRTMGTVVGRGGQLITGITSNPFAVMCVQGDFAYRLLSDACPLIHENGDLIDSCLDRRVEYHFNFLLDLVDYSRHTKADDCSLLEGMYEAHRIYLNRSRKTFSTAENEILNFHISNLEYSCGANLNDVSCFHWSQNEQFAQFAGNHALVTSGCSSVTEKLAESSDIRLNQRVVQIDYSQPGAVGLLTDSGERYACDKVLVTVPLAVLKKKTVTFVPALPARKERAIEALGCGMLEKVALQFSVKFWSVMVKSTDFFGHVSSVATPRGMFSIFYDFSPRDAERADRPPYVLMCYLSGEAVGLVKLETDEGLVALCLKTLRKLFPTKDIPEPLSYMVTRWSEDDDIGMAYSYIRVGASGSDYDAMAAEVEGKVFFSGEATNRQFPQTFTGAVVSGLREAYKIMR